MIDDVNVELGEVLNVGTSNYNELSNKPQINSIELIGNKTPSELHLQEEMEDITNEEINNLFRNREEN